MLQSPIRSRKASTLAISTYCPGILAVLTSRRLSITLFLLVSAINETNTPNLRVFSDAGNGDMPGAAEDFFDLVDSAEIWSEDHFHLHFPPLRVSSWFSSIVLHVSIQRGQG